MIIPLRSCIQRIKLHRKFNQQFYRNLTVFGIETSCDDTGCAVVDDSGKILGESRFSQAQIHWDNGGIIPNFAKEFHQKNIKTAANIALSQANMTLRDVDAIAVTVKPGLGVSLLIGVEYAKDMCTLYNKPLMPIHHMEAHALTARLIEKVELPFLTLLISGGHCLLALAKSVDKFYILGESMDTSPGVLFDKIARRLKLSYLKRFRNFHGGVLIEKASREGNPEAFSYGFQLSDYKDCNFALSGLAGKTNTIIKAEEKKYDLEPDQVLPSACDICATFQWSLTKHLCQRIQRATEYVRLKNLIPQEEKCLVMSGGVASNKFIRTMVQKLCDEVGYKLIVPPPQLCTDNGVMIAWNGVERLKANIRPVSPDDLRSVDIVTKCPLGESLSDDIVRADIKCKWIKLDPTVNEKQISEKNAGKIQN